SGNGYRQLEAPTGEKKGRPPDAGENPPNGAVVHYWLKEAPPGDVTLSFLDAEGRQIRSFSRSADGSSAPKDGADEEPRPTKNTGANRFVWNLRGPDATKLPDNKGRGGTVDALAAPRVPPGRYQVRLTVGGRSLTQPFTLVKDPRVLATDEDLQTQYAWAKRAHGLLERVHVGVMTLSAVRALVDVRATRTVH